ncbi:MAG: alpha-amylase family glycosyl hydrolase, partial [Chthoniobacterales bacterium]
MKRSILSLLLVSVFSLAPVSIVGAQDAPPQLRSFLGWMPMQPVTAGGQLLLDMHRFYFAKPGAGDDLELPEAVPGQFAARFDKAAFMLGVQIDREASGLVEIPIRVFERDAANRDDLGRKDTSTTATPDDANEPVLEGVLLIGVQPADGYTFTYRPTGPDVKTVAVAGQFNGWNTESHQLKPAAGGTYELFVSMPPGAHPYKLVVDGAWQLDPANPEKLDDGTGNENSIARVGTTDRGNPPVVYAGEAGEGQAVFRIVRGGSDIKQVSAVAQMPDGSSRVAEYELSGDTVTVDTADWPDGAWARVVVADEKGNVSNAARVRAKATSDFQWQDGIIYYAFTDRFANGDESNDRPVQDERVLPPANYQGGDFQGIRKKIDEGYFRDLGVNVLWLAPLNRNPDGAWQEYLEPYRFYTGYHGYWPISHTEVEPRFGGESALNEMISAAHGNQMFIIADLVLKHVHTDHPMWKEKPELFGSLELPDGT